MLLRILATLLVCWAHIALAAAAFAQEPARIALLIGNKDYKPAVGPLTNTHKDVEIVGAALRQLGFNVTIIKDADYRKMDVAIRRHVDRVREAGAGAITFFYYSGHGVANPDSNSNYLIPVDVERADTDDIWYASFEQSTVIDRLNQLAPQARHLIVFDACRDELNLTRVGKALGVTKGFLPVREVRGMLIAYATAEKRTAADTGIFAKILAEEMVRPGVEAVAMFRRVQLRAESEMKQEPWMSLRYLPETFLADRPHHVGEAARAPMSDAAIAWSAVQNTESEAVLEEYIRQFGQSLFGGFANARLTELRQRKISHGAHPESPVVTERKQGAQDKPTATDGYTISESTRAAVSVVREQYGHAIAFSPDGSLLAADDGWNINLWFAATGNLAHSFTGHEGQVKSLSFSSNGRFLASGATDGTARIWEITTKRSVRSIRHLEKADSNRLAAPQVAFSRDGNSIFTASYDGIIRRWNIATGTTVSNFNVPPFKDPGPRDELSNRRWSAATLDVMSIAVSTDGKLLASVGYGDGSDVQIWDIATGKLTYSKQLRPISLTDPLGGFAPFVVKFSPDGGTLAVGGVNALGPPRERKNFVEILLWNFLREEEPVSFIRTPGDNISANKFDWTWDGKQLGLAHIFHTTIMEVATSLQVAKFSSPQSNKSCGQQEIAFSPDGVTLALTSCEWGNTNGIRLSDVRDLPR